MKLSISNIAWNSNLDDQVYEIMKQYDFTGLEIAPTRLFSEQPYEKINEAREWKEKIFSEHGFIISSMQSIWFGRQERIFGTKDERKILIDYTKKAIDFAASIECKNLVFGCPKNRNIPDGADPKTAIHFFKESGDYAADMGTTIALEANPTIYNTNYINDTLSAFELMERVKSEGFKINLDLGTILQNGENISELTGRVHFINHIHISEPGLKPIEERVVHEKLKQLLIDEDYQGFISIEMEKTNDILMIEDKIRYVRKIFNE